MNIIFFFLLSTKTPSLPSQWKKLSNNLIWNVEVNFHSSLVQSLLFTFDNLHSSWQPICICICICICILWFPLSCSHFSFLFLTGGRMYLTVSLGENDWVSNKISFQRRPPKKSWMDAPKFRRFSKKNQIKSLFHPNLIFTYGCWCRVP